MRTRRHTPTPEVSPSILNEDTKCIFCKEFLNWVLVICPLYRLHPSYHFMSGPLRLPSPWGVVQPACVLSPSWLTLGRDSQVCSDGNEQLISRTDRQMKVPVLRKMSQLSASWLLRVAGPSSNYKTLFDYFWPLIPVIWDEHASFWQYSGKRDFGTRLRFHHCNGKKLYRFYSEIFRARNPKWAKWEDGSVFERWEAGRLDDLPFFFVLQFCPYFHNLLHRKTFLEPSTFSYLSKTWRKSQTSGTS